VPEGGEAVLGLVDGVAGGGVDAHGLLGGPFFDGGGVEEFELAGGDLRAEAFEGEVADVGKPFFFGEGREGVVGGRDVGGGEGGFAGVAPGVAALEVADAVEGRPGEPGVEAALGAVVVEGADARGKLGKQGLDDVFGVGMAQAVALGQGADVGGVLGEEAFPGGAVGGIADAFEDAGMRGTGLEGGGRHGAEGGRRATLRVARAEDFAGEDGAAEVVAGAEGGAYGGGGGAGVARR